MVAHDERQAPGRLVPPDAGELDEQEIGRALSRAVGGTFPEARFRITRHLLAVTIEAGGAAARAAFLAAAATAEGYDRHGRPRAKILSRAHAGDTRAREGAPVPERGTP